MQRRIVGFHTDDEGHWVAELDCGHGQHTRHDPPRVERPWVLERAGRESAIGRELACVLCDRREVPAGFEPYRRTPIFDAETLPAALRRRHTTKAGIWARIHVQKGRLLYLIHEPFDEQAMLEPGRIGIVVPEVPHAVEPQGEVELFIEFHRAPSDLTQPPEHLRGVTSEWVGEVLELPTRGLSFERIGLFSSELWRLRLEATEPQPERPMSLVLKSPKQIDDGLVSREFDEESTFYRELSAKLSARTPRAFYVGPAPGSKLPILLLEDVVDLDPISFLEGASDEHMKLGIDALARLHAHWWNAVDDLDWIPHLGLEEERARIAHDFDAAWSTLRETLGDRYGAAVRSVGDAVVGRLQSVLAPLGERATLLHGDAHFENCPLANLPGGGHEVVLLDWANVTRGQAALDVAVFVVMSLPASRRRQHEESLVARHAETVRHEGIEAWSDPWRDYRVGVLRRFAGMIEIAARMTPGALHQWDAGSDVMNRCMTAAADLRCDLLVDD